MPKQITKKDERVASAMGGSGTSIYNGVFFNSEYNSKLDTEYGGPGLDVYDKMEKSDPVVGGGLDLIKLTIRQAEWYVEAGSDAPKDVEAADFIKDALFNRMSITFPELLEDILTGLQFGFFVGEKIYKFSMGQMILDRIMYMDQRSIARFETIDHKPGVTQYLDGDEAKEKGKREVDIPMKKLVILTLNKRGKNLRGRSILRRAWKPWFFKESFERINAVGFEREAVGIPVFIQPPTVNPEDVTKAEEMGKNLRFAEKSYLILPNGWEFDVKYPTGGNRKSAKENIDSCNSEILTSLMAQWMLLGQGGGGGGYSLSQDLSSTFYKAAQAFCDLIAAVFARDVIKELVDLNIMGVDKYPKLNATGIEKIDPAIYSTAISSLIGSGALQPDDESEAFLRKQLRLPDMPEELKQLRAKKQEMDLQQKKLGLDSTQAGIEQVRAGVNPMLNKGNPAPGDNKKKDKPVAKKLSESAAIQLAELNRELTLAEEKVDFESIENQMNILEDQIILDLPRLMSGALSDLYVGISNAVAAKDAKMADDLTVTFKADIRSYILEKFRSAFETGKITAANEVGIGAPRTPTELINLLTSKANMIADKLTADVLNDAKLQTISHIEIGSNVDTATSAIEANLRASLEKSIATTASAVISGGINSGRAVAFQTGAENVYAFQRSEILDKRICNYCLSLDGRTVEPGDPLLLQGQFHFKCRGIWVAVMKDEQELPAITGVPQDLRERIGSLNDFKQMDTARPLKDSLAADFVR
jgi:hypothetical protein